MLARTVEYADWAFIAKKDPTNECPGYDKNNLIMRLQSWSFGRRKVSLHRYYSKVHSDPRVRVTCVKERPHQWVSWLWHKTIWLWGFDPGALEDVEYLIIAITPRSTLTQEAVPARVKYERQIEVFHRLLDLKPVVCNQMINIKLNY